MSTGRDNTGCWLVADRGGRLAAASVARRTKAEPSRPAFRARRHSWGFVKGGLLKTPGEVSNHSCLWWRMAREWGGIACTADYRSIRTRGRGACPRDIPVPRLLAGQHADAVTAGSPGDERVADARPKPRDRLGRHATRAARPACRRLPAKRGSGCGRGLAEVLGWTDKPPLSKLHAVVDGTSVAKADEVERPDVHDGLESFEFVVARLDVSAVGVDGGLEALLVRPTWVPGNPCPKSGTQSRRGAVRALTPSS